MGDKKGGVLVMARKHVGKEGISPLIATVLIVGFTVALAVIIFNWLGVFSRDLQEGTTSGADAQLACTQNIDLDIRDANCVSGPLTITIANNANQDIEGFKVRVTAKGAPGTVLNGDITTKLLKFEVKPLPVSGSLPPEPAVVEVIPIIKVNGVDQTCTGATSSYGDLGVKLTGCV